MEHAMLEKIHSLAQIDIDAVACYDEAIEHIDDADIASTLESFRDDHQRHVDQLSAIISSYGGTPPDGSPDLKGYLLEGMTMLRSAISTANALKAIEQGEKITNKHYEEAMEWDVPADVSDIIEQNMEDEREHLIYVQSELRLVA